MPVIAHAPRRRRRVRRSRWKRALAWLARLLLAWVLLDVAVVGALRFVPPPTSAFMIERSVAARVHGEAHFQLHYRWTGWNDFSRQLPISVIAAEDQKFPYHHGFDVEAIQDALAEADEGARLRGASTISQQVAKNLFLWNGRSFVRKGLEAWFTVLIEALWPKRRILEVYCNIAEFGNGIYGVDAASRLLFRQAPARLDAHQAALLAAVLPNPRRFDAAHPSAHVERRALWIERQARQLGGIAYLP
jgi:monofunctional biosynthetic peptidoglycan transglycosylase